MIPCEILKGLPSDGAPAIPFPADSAARYSEGLVVRFGAGGESWVGNFLRGGYGFDWVGPMPDGDHLLVVSQGAGYVVDPASRLLVTEIGAGISEVIADEARRLLILVDIGSCDIEAFGPEGRVWTTGQISWDGFRNVRVAGDVIVGEAYQPWTPDWVPFTVDVETGAVSGGAKR